MAPSIWVRGRQPRSAGNRRQSAEPDAPGGGAVLEVTEQTFNIDVVERSRTVPVVIDLWAEWCGPCKQLSPVLEKLAAEGGGQWILAKVDVDANPQLSAALQVQSIPMVMAVIGGQLVDGFLGAMPEAQVRQWLAQVLAVAEKLGLDAAPARPRGRRRARRRGPRRAAGPGVTRARCRPPSPRPARPWSAATWTARPGPSSRRWPPTRANRPPRPGWPRST